jgi:hypothetical protein
VTRQLGRVALRTFLPVPASIAWVADDGQRHLDPTTVGVGEQHSVLAQSRLAIRDRGEHPVFLVGHGSKGLLGFLAVLTEAEPAQLSAVTGHTAEDRRWGPEIARNRLTDENLGRPGYGWKQDTPTEENI